VRGAGEGAQPAAGERVAADVPPQPSNLVRWVPLAYAIVAGTWIAVSDTLVAAASPSVEILRTWSVAKGFAFVLATTVALHAGLRWAVSRERRAREALRRYELLAAHGPEVILFVRPGDGRILDANAAALATYGYGREELAALSVYDLRAPGTGDLAAAQLAAADAGGLRFETVHRRKDGSTLPVEVSSHGATLDGARVLVSVVRDVSQRRLAEEALRESEERLALAVEAAGLGTFHAAPWGELVLSPRAREIFALAAGQRIPDFEAFLRLVHPDDRDTVRAAATRWLDTGGGGRYHGEYRCLRPDGTVGWVSVHGIARFADAGGARTPVRLVGTILDVTELKAVQAQLMQADRLASIGMLAAGVAHEINNPLAYVTGALDFLAETLPELLSGAKEGARAEVLQALGEARDGAGRVRHVARDLATFSSMREDRRAPIELRPVVESAVNLAANEIRSRARLVRAWGAAPRVVANEARLGQVVLNLLINAAQATPEGHADEHEIRVSTGTDAEGGAVIAVSDSGCGLPPGEIDRIFEPFFTTKPRGVGTGLGLSICRDIVRALGGRISAERRAPGPGTTFRVTLPPAAALPDAASPPDRDAGAGGRRGRILVVDDEPIVANAIRRVLASEHEVTVVTRAEDARDAIARGERFDAILCDLMMPHMTGMELHAALERLAPDQARRMVVLTGGAFTEGGREFLGRVPLPCVEKPFETRDLKAVVRGLVS
jgi:PAS domain S-box-containing protein